MPKTLTIEDIRSSESKTGFRYVAKPDPARRGGRPYRAIKAIGKTRNGWQGPRRFTPEEAAQDYCDYVNGNAISSAPQLKTPNHPQRKNGKASEREKELYAAYRAEREKRIAKQPKADGHVYLIGMIGNDSAVKIGHSTDTRLADLQTGNPYELTLLGTIPGTQDKERELHAKYIEDNILLEWFRPTPELLSEFDSG